ncbi:SDR family oxidoreductase [Saccharopolyspora sp. TS4A08]|uniref:SDR family oxidoreductase n=1 Tax=Saccharopolyspora ipomoeae TaxID=3042027 RepID=A0ABT6PRE2_9PSEU|nr:SDR family oxidoreductase [Saccharopolyspora sp. TS4A08]MDI2030560.1 SDR family oxidoreductase [Saccharopolyspora sp. TS4A08]
MLSFDIAGKHVVITGGGGGIGGATAVEMADLGATVTVLDQDRDRAQSVVDKITTAGGTAHAAVLDLSDVDQVRSAFAALERPCDILVNTAGLIKYTSLLEQDEDSFDQLLAVNLRGTFFCLQEAAKQMTSGSGGAIVNLASTAAFVAARLPATAYAMTKAGVRQLTTAASTELAPQGVRVNAVAPATIETPFVKGTIDTPEQRAATAARSPIGRIGQPADVVGAIVFLASPLAGFITGHTLVIDGGRLGRAS